MSATGSPKVAPARVATVPSPTTASPEGIVGQPYPIRIPDGECLALCTGYFWDRKSRRFGERIYLDFRVFDGEYAGKELQMFLKPSRSYSSKFYRSWSIAHDGPPRSRNTKMSPKIFVDKLFRVRTSTVRPRHQLTGPDGKQRPGEPLPECLWYSKVDCLLSLEATNEATSLPVVAFHPKPDGAPPFIVTEISPNSFPHREMRTGGVGRRTLEVGHWVREAGFSGWGGQSTNAPQPAGGGRDSAAGPTPVHSTIAERAPSSARPSDGRDNRLSKADLETAIYRKRLFELYDNLPPKFDHNRRVEEMTYKATRDLFGNRGRELEGVSESAVLERALSRLGGFRDFEAIRDFERRRNCVVAAVVNAVVDAAIVSRIGERSKEK